MTAESVIRSIGDEREAAEKALQAEKADHANTLSELHWWRDRAGIAEQEREDMGRVLADVRERVVHLERMYAREVAAAAYARRELATARAEVEALKGNR